MVIESSAYPLNMTITTPKKIAPKYSCPSDSLFWCNLGRRKTVDAIQAMMPICTPIQFTQAIASLHRILGKPTRIKAAPPKAKEERKSARRWQRRLNGKNNQYLHSFEDVDKGVASHQKNFLCKIGLEKLHTCYWISFKWESCLVALVFWIRDR